MKSSTTTRALIGLLASAAFLWTLTLSVSPQLHERIHPDANRIDHSCAITFIASGSYNYSPAAPLLSVPALVDQFSSIPTLTPQWVESSFLLARVFEHAPPAHS
ncbi:MAG TPA: hypothetical protein VNN16_05300 [Candidatus Sulfotelmatobacter sp.]|jgi:hypothetical protein|nr:hypothetical protein [Candidatus Sulfotelmatobacter sp.]